MKKLRILVAAAIALGTASGANAAQTLVISGPSGTFGDDEVVCADGATASGNRATMLAVAGRNSARKAYGSCWVCAANSSTSSAALT